MANDTAVAIDPSDLDSSDAEVEEIDSSDLESIFSSDAEVEEIDSPALDDSFPQPCLNNHAYGLSPDALKRLLLFRVPPEFILILELLNGLGCLGANLSPLVLVEFFCGAAELQRAFECEFPRKTFGYDCLRDRLAQDILTPAGFLLAIILVFRLGRSAHIDALAWFGTQCSSFVWLSRSKTGRSRWNPRGDRTRYKVCRANTMVARCCLLMALGVALQVLLGLEQPDTSIMGFLPCLTWIRTICCKHFGGGLSVNHS